jgi:energy-coupling factor transporter ATP-binding protein EcfA2
MITVESISRTYGTFTAVDNVSFAAHPGRVTGFLGANGAGMSTTLRVIVGLTRASSGTATVAGRSYPDLPKPAREVGVLLDGSATTPWACGNASASRPRSPRPSTNSAKNSVVRPGWPSLGSAPFAGYSCALFLLFVLRGIVSTNGSTDLRAWRERRPLAGPPGRPPVTTDRAGPLPL